MWSLFFLCEAVMVLAGGATPPQLRVCADPANLPFSDKAGQGFEDELARLVARDLHLQPTWVWLPQRRGFVRNTLKAHQCDVIMGVPEGYELTRTTQAYYRSTYVALTRKDRHLDISSVDDPRLATLRIGVHTVGDDYASTPPAQALGRRGLAAQLVGFPITGDARQATPTAAIVDAVADGSIDVALVWGPLAGYFARHSPVPLQVTPLVAGPGDPPFTFAIAMGVRKDDGELAARLDQVIQRRRAAIGALLARYGVPLVRP